MPADSSTHTLRFTVLNGVTASRGERALALGPPQRRALLCVLALRRRQWVSVSGLVDALYENDVPAGATKVIQTHVSALRGVLEPPRPAGTPPSVLLYDHGGYQLRITDDQLDLGRFDRLVGEADRARARQRWRTADAIYARALALFTSEPLPGVPGPYAEHQRAALRERRLVVVEDSLDAAVGGGRAEQVIDQLSVLTREHPLRERPHALLMRALYAGGRQSEALQVYTRSRELLVEQLGVEPGGELRALHARILAGEPLQRPLDEPQAATEPAPPAPGRIVGPPLVGRDHEIGQIGLLAAQAASGQGGLVLISGRYGMGKSRLLREVAGTLPASRWLPLAGEAAPALVSGLCEALGPPEHPAPPATADARALADWAVRELAGRAAVSEPDGANRPLVLLADDAGDADPVSRQALVLLAQRLRRQPVLLIQAMPGTRRDTATALWQAELESLAVLTLPLGPLGAPAIAELIGHGQDAQNPEPLATVIRDVTGGVPLLVNALLADLRPLRDWHGLPTDLVPEHFTRALTRLLHRHDPRDAELVRALAVLTAHEPSADLLAAVCEQPLAETLQRCASLACRGVLASAEPPRLRHPLIAAALLDGCSTTETSSLRVAAARWAQLRQRPAREIADYLGELTGTAWAPWSVVLIDAANDCLRAGDATPGIRYLEAAARIAAPTERAAVLLRLGQAELQTNPNAACIHLEEALQAQRDRGEPPTAVVPLAWVLVSQGKTAAAIELMDTVIAETEKADPRAARAVRAAGWVISSLTPDTWHALMRRLSTTRSTSAADDAIASALLLWDDAARLRYSAQETMARFPTARTLPDATELPRQLVGLRAALAVWCDDFTLVDRLCDQPSDHDFAAVDLSRVMSRTEIALRRGDFRRALNESRLLASVPPEQNVRRPAALVALYAYALIGLGRTEEAERWLDSTHHHAEPETWPWITVLYVRGLLRSAQGDAGRAAAHFLDCGRRVAAWGIESPGFQPWRSSAALELARAGDHDRARLLAEEALDTARRWGAPRPLGMAWRATAATLAPKDRIAPLEEAVAVLEPSEARIEFATALTDLAEAHAATGSPQRARHFLRRARDIAGPLGAAPLVKRVDDHVRALDAQGSRAGC
ncbi:BTAD domain-containing putative transcriptional regulator [Streptomyces sp. PmtG]